MIQAVLPCLLFASKKSNIVMKGGTNVDFAPPIDYLTQVFAVAAKNFGINFNCNLIKRFVILSSLIILHTIRD